MSQSFTQQRNTIIARAMRLARILAYNQTPTTVQYTEGAEAFNALLNHVQALDVEEFTKQWVVQALTQSSVVVGSDSKLYRCIRGHTSATATNKPRTGSQWNAYWIQDDTAIPDWDSTQAYRIGDIVTSGASYYVCTQANEASSVAVTDAAYWGAYSTTWSNGAAYVSSGDFAYTTAFAIMDAFIRYDGDDYPVVISEMKDVFEIETKNDKGIPTHLFYDRLAGYRIVLDPQPSVEVVSRGTLHLLQVRWLTDGSASTTALDLPPTWHDFFSYALAANMADEGGLPQDRVTYLQTKAAGLFNQLKTTPFKFENHPERIRSAF